MRRRVTHDSAPLPTLVPGARLPLPADGAARVGDVIWHWADEGCLFAVPAPEAP